VASSRVVSSVEPGLQAGGRNEYSFPFQQPTIPDKKLQGRQCFVPKLQVKTVNAIYKTLTPIKTPHNNLPRPCSLLGIAP
jgi:hypothetical protein